jgi:hypothetical protein
LEKAEVFPARKSKFSQGKIIPGKEKVFIHLYPRIPSWKKGSPETQRQATQHECLPSLLGVMETNK